MFTQSLSPQDGAHRDYGMAYGYGLEVPTGAGDPA
jgi:hypothetical protein